MLTDTPRWSHARDNEVVPSPWQATTVTHAHSSHCARNNNAIPATVKMVASKPSFVRYKRCC